MADTRVLENGTDVRVLQNGTDVRVTETTLNNYSMSADAASFAVTPNAVGLRAGRKVSATQASYAITPNATGLRKGSKLSAATQSFAITPQTAGIRKGSKVSANAQSFALTPHIVALSRSLRLRAELPVHTPFNLEVINVSQTSIEFGWEVLPQSFNIVPNQAQLGKFTVFSVNAAVFDFTPHDVGIRRTPPAMNATAPAGIPQNVVAEPSDVYIELSWEDGPAFGVNTNQVSLTAERRLNAQTQGFTFSPYSTTLFYNSARVISAEASSFAITPHTAGLVAGRILRLTPDSFSITPSSAELRRTSFVQTQPGEFTFTPNAIQFLGGYHLGAESSEVFFTPAAIAILKGSLLSAEPVTFVFTPQSISSAEPLDLTPPYVLYLESGETYIVLSSGETIVHLNSGETYLRQE